MQILNKLFNIIFTPNIDVIGQIDMAFYFKLIKLVNYNNNDLYDII